MDSIELLQAAGAIDLANGEPRPSEPAQLATAESVQPGQELLALFESLMRTLGMEAQPAADEGGLVPIADFYGQMLDMLHDEGSSGDSPLNG